MQNAECYYYFMKSGRILAMGGLGQCETLISPLLEHLLELSGMSDPKVCVITTANGDNPICIPLLEQCFSTVPTLNYFRIFDEDGPSSLDVIHENDVVLVPGGNTNATLALWKHLGVDVALREYWNEGGLLGGWSAGSLCWFESGLSNSIKTGEYHPLYNGLGLLTGSHSPHYDNEEIQQKYRSAIGEGFLPSGYGIGDSAAIYFVGNKIENVITADPQSIVEKVSIAEGNELLIEISDAELLD